MKSAKAPELVLPELVTQMRERVARVFRVGDAARDRGADQSVIARKKKCPRSVIVAYIECRAPRIRQVTYEPNMLASEGESQTQVALIGLSRTPARSSHYPNPGIRPAA